MSDKRNNPEDRFSDGFIMEVDGVVDYDSEAAFYGTASRVGKKVQKPKMQDDWSPEAKAQAKRAGLESGFVHQVIKTGDGKRKITKDQRAKLHRLGFGK